MGKAGRWFKSFLTRKKDQKTSNLGNTCQDNASNSQDSTTLTVPRLSNPKEKRRWSFRRSSATATVGSKDPDPTKIVKAFPDQKKELADQEKNQTKAVATAESNAEVSAVKPIEVETVETCQLTKLTVSDNGSNSAIEEAAAITVQSVYRSYLARKALRALRGLVKLQALVRGHLVRKQATVTLRCMQALVTAQARARAQRIHTIEDGKNINHRQSIHRSSQEMMKHSDHDVEENIKIVEMDQGEFNSMNRVRDNYSFVCHQQQNVDRMEKIRMLNCHSSKQVLYLKQDYSNFSPTPSTITGISPRTYSGYFEDYLFATTQSSPQCYSIKSELDPSSIPFSFPRPENFETTSYDYPLYPNYMANTKSSRAKARSQSAPKQRPECERQPSRGRRASIEGRGIPKAARMQRSSSHVGSSTQNYQYPC